MNATNNINSNSNNSVYYSSRNNDNVYNRLRGVLHGGLHVAAAVPGAIIYYDITYYDIL